MGGSGERRAEVAGGEVFERLEATNQINEIHAKRRTYAFEGFKPWLCPNPPLK
jgi:hypothetical protein